MTEILDQSKYNLLERRPERVAKQAIRREHVKVGGSNIFFSVIPADSDMLSAGDVGLVYPTPDDRDITGREIVARELDAGSGADIPSAIIDFVHQNPAEFSYLDPSQL
jgi:hypothetical protein